MFWGLVGDRCRGRHTVHECWLSANVGKTAALVCAVLAAQQELKRRDPHNYPQIVYCTRTHGQVQQVNAEMQGTLPPAGGAVGERGGVKISLASLSSSMSTTLPSIVQ